MNFAWHLSYLYDQLQILGQLSGSRCLAMSVTKICCYRGISLLSLFAQKNIFGVNLHRVETSRCRRAVTLESSLIWALQFEMAAFYSHEWQRCYLIQKQNSSPRKEAKSQLQYLSQANLVRLTGILSP